MHIQDGRIGLTKKELADMKAQGFDVSEHTSYYMNFVGVRFGEHAAIGLYNWLDNLNAYIADEEIVVNTREQAIAFIRAMDALLALRKALSTPAPAGDVKGGV